MRVGWRQLWKSAYRRYPLFSFALTIGAVNAVIGAFNDRPALTTFGIGAVGIALVLRWWESQKRVASPSEQMPLHYLPPASSGPQLPTLRASRKKPPVS